MCTDARRHLRRVLTVVAENAAPLYAAGRSEGGLRDTIPEPPWA